MYKLKDVFNEVTTEKTEKMQKLSALKAKLKELKKNNAAVNKHVSEAEKAIDAMQKRTDELVGTVSNYRKTIIDLNVTSIDGKSEFTGILMYSHIKNVPNFSSKQ